MFFFEIIERVDHIGAKWTKKLFIKSKAWITVLIFRVHEAWDITKVAFDVVNTFLDGFHPGSAFFLAISAEGTLSKEAVFYWGFFLLLLLVIRQLFNEKDELSDMISGIETIEFSILLLVCKCLHSFLFAFFVHTDMINNTFSHLHTEMLMVYIPFLEPLIGFHPNFVQFSFLGINLLHHVVVVCISYLHNLVDVFFSFVF